MPIGRTYRSSRSGRAHGRAEPLRGDDAYITPNHHQATISTVQELPGGIGVPSALSAVGMLPPPYSRPHPGPQLLLAARRDHYARPICP